MLVLTRKAGETIRIGDDISIRVIRTHAGRVRIGIVAPDDVPIGRGELCHTKELGEKAGRVARVEHVECELELAGSGVFSMNEVFPSDSRPRFPR